MEHYPDSSPVFGVKLIPLGEVRPAPYNPRKITLEKTKLLQESLRYVGFGKPIILNVDGTIIAGHQRSRAAREIGLSAVPAYVMQNVSEEDEVRFNQIHNSSDIDGDARVCVPPWTGTGFRAVGPIDIEFDELPMGANARAMIHVLFLRHGQFSAVIASQDGEILSGQQYAVSMHALNRPLLVYYIEQDKKAKAREYLTDQYGEFSYDHLAKETYVQSFAQKYRLRSDSHGRSTLYENFVIPNIRKSDRVFDFGCGQADYLKQLARKRYNIAGLEFYYREGNSLNLGAINQMVDHLLTEIPKKRYDVVVCDSVLNSVDTLDAESDVVHVCNLLLRPGGTLYISGRRWEFVDGLARNRVLKDFRKRNIEFLDEHGFSALYRAGRWFYQKYHTSEMARELIERHGFEVLHHEEKISTSSWQITARKIEDSPVDEGLAAINREFGLPLPDGKRHAYSDRAVEVFKKVYTHAANDSTY